MTLATGQVINQAIDLFFIGLPGVAKTHLAQAIGSGFSVERSWSWVAEEPVEVPVEVRFITLGMPFRQLRRRRLEVRLLS